VNVVLPIKSKKQISALRKILRAGPNGLRNEAFFVLGINSAFRIGDLLALKVGDVLDPEKGKLKKRISLKEQKTQKNRQIFVNDSISKVLEGYLESRGPLKDLNPREPLFPSSQNSQKPICRQRVHQILKEAGNELNLTDFGPHSLRKTFGYHIFIMTGNNVALVQKLLNHSAPGVTLRYIGIEQADMDAACKRLNLY
jgi:integrase